MKPQINWTTWAQEIHAGNVARGFWDEPYSYRVVMLIQSELFEAFEADRKGRCFDKQNKERFDVFDNGAMLSFEESETTRLVFKDLFDMYIKDTFEDELADTFIRCMDLIGYIESNEERAIDLGFSYWDKWKSWSPEANILSGGWSMCRENWQKLSFVINLIHGSSLQNVYYNCMDVISCLLDHAKQQEFDLIWHVRMKLKYNSLRPKKHGKKY